MTILSSDIKLRASVVMADVPEGGGGPSAKVINWGDSNTIFEDVDSVSRTLGNVSIRQLHSHVDTDSTDKLLGSYAIVAKTPDDAKVNVTLATCNPFDRRTQIQTAIANYLIRGTQWNGFLLENHVQGQGNIQILQRQGTRTPTIGRTLVLVLNEGKPTESLQYVRVIDVATEDRTFTDDKGDFYGTVVKCTLQSPLAQAFPGSSPNRFWALAAGAAIIRDTTEADAANYYGAARLSQAAHINDLQVKVASVYSQLVPNSQTSVPVLDQRPASRKTITLATAPRQIDVTVTPHTSRVKIGQENRGLSFVMQCTPPPERGTLVIAWVGLGNRYNVSDNGSGVLAGDGAGVINYATGSVALTLPSLPDVGSAIVFNWGERIAYTDRSSQGAQMRPPALTFVLPNTGYVRGSLAITWTSGGATKTATASAAGIITGDATGIIDAPSGAVYFTPTAMIDSGGQFSVAYSTVDVVTENIALPTLDSGGFATLNLAQQPAAGTLQIGWKTTQEVSTTSGTSLDSSSINKAAQTYSITGYYTWITTYTKDQTGGSGNTSSSSSTQDGTQKVVTTYAASDDGNGNIVGGLGTVNYTGKSVNLRFVTKGKSASSYKSDYEDASEFAQSTTNAPSTSGNQSNKGGSYGTTSVGEELLAASTVTVRYIVGAPTPTPRTASVTPPPMAIDVCPYTTDRIVPGSLQFTWMGHTYQDFEGAIYRDRTGASNGVASGSVNYAAGLVTLTDYAVGPDPTTLTLQSLWTQKGDWTTASLFFMTEASPIQPGQITITVTDVQGNLINVACDLNGNLTGPHASGKFEFQNGLGELQFGDFVDDAALTTAQKSEWWYSPGDVGAVQAGKIWRPWPVDPTSLRYNAVSNFYLPVDPAILGLDPVRLPQDGRVPIFKKGRIVMLGHNAAMDPATLGNGQVINVGRTRVSNVWIIGKDGKLITTGWSATEADLDAGRVHIDDVTGWSQPVTIEHRIQDMALCTDVQIDGSVNVNIPVSHEFPAGAVLSSTVLFGDSFARALPIFSQKTWDGITWSNSVQGDPSVARYNDAAFPVTVTNAGALSERFALRMRSDATTFDLIGEHLGQIASGTINADFEPSNPFNAGKKLFKLKSAGWGSGWVAGNVLFLQTVGAMSPMACIRTVQPGQATSNDYEFDLLTGGDIDRPPSAGA